MKDNIQKKKVLIDLSVLKHPYCGLGQIALNYLRLINSLDTDELPFRIVLLVPRKYFGCCGNKVDYVPRKRIYKFLPWLYPKVDVWHAIHQLSPFMPYSSHTRYLLTIHDFNFMYEKSDKVSAQYKQRIQRRIDLAQTVVCISEFTKSELYKYMHVEDNLPVRVIYDGVEFPQKDVLVAQPEFVAPQHSKQFFFSIGEVKEKKNFLSIVKMMKYFPERHLYIAGKDNAPYADTIRKYISDNNLSNVTLTGIVSNSARLWLYQHCEAFLFPSLFEGFGLPVIEAMSLGKPVFCSKETSLKEIGGNQACFFTSFEAEEMAQLIKDNLTQLQEQQAVQARADYARRFNYDKHFKQYLDLYTQLCND